MRTPVQYPSRPVGSVARHTDLHAHAHALVQVRCGVVTQHDGLEASRKGALLVEVVLEVDHRQHLYRWLH